VPDSDLIAGYPYLIASVNVPLHDIAIDQRRLLRRAEPAVEPVNKRMIAPPHDAAPLAVRILRNVAERHVDAVDELARKVAQRPV
jgi:ribosomal protein L31E